VVTEGETTDEPPEKVYVAAPLGTMVKLLVLQMVPLFTVIAGLGATVMVVMACVGDKQPSELVPVTE
jgi:hypothetical protein